MALGVPGRLRPRIISTFGTTRVVGHQPYAPAAFTPGEIPGAHFQRLSRPKGTCFFSEGTTEKKSPVTPPGIDPGTVRLVAQRLNHYTTPGPRLKIPAASLFALPSHFLNKLSFIFSISSLICLISCSNLSLSSFQFVSCLSSVSRPILYRYIFSSCIVFHIL